MAKWISVSEAAVALKISERSVRRLATEGKIGRQGSGANTRYTVPESERKPSVAAGTLAFNTVPEFARQHAFKYLSIISECKGLSGDDLEQWVCEWNKKHPEDNISASSIVRSRAKILKDGAQALIANWGARANLSVVQDDWYAFFKGLYLKERGPSLRFCWQQTLGYASGNDETITPQSFPSPAAFLRRLKAQEGFAAIDYARNGAKKWLNKHSFYIARDWTNVLAGQIWVGDHHQLDVCAQIDNGDLVYPWLSAWCDGKSGKFVGWELRAEDPNSDAILMSFHRAGRDNPICAAAYIDNGKDYRSRSVSGGTHRIRIEADPDRVKSMFEMLCVDVHFALPYNARAKIIERQFLNFKNWLSSSLPGYRGGNSAERPVELKDTIAKHGVIPFDELYALVSTYINEVCNRMIVSSGHRAGKCPDQIWQEELPAAIDKGIVKVIGADALALCCTRVSNVVTVRNGRIRDSQLNVAYFDDALIGLEGEKVYVRRDPYRYETAWVFSAKDHRMLCSAQILPAIPGLVVSDIERQDLQNVLKLQRAHARTIRTAARSGMEISPREKMVAAARGAAVLNRANGWEPDAIDTSAASPVFTGMEGVMQAEQKRRLIGRHDPREFAPEPVLRDRGTWDVVNGYVPAAASAG